MLQAISALKGFAIEASDGRMGTAADFLFDDVSWRVRWLVVDCGSWLKGRKVLISTSAISYADVEDGECEVELTKAQVEGSPELLEHQPVSQQVQSRLYGYYGWDPLWDEAPNLGAAPGEMASPLRAPPALSAQTREGPLDEAAVSEEADDHLHSVFEVIGYHIDAIDGEIGHVEDFMFDNEDWRLRYLIVDTSNWWFGKRVLISTHAVKAIVRSDRQVHLDVSREQVQSSPPWDPLAAFDPAYAARLHSHYGWPGSAA
jgi:uncharacterized protein YrrD